MTISFVLSVASLILVVLSFFFFRWYIARKTAARELLADYRAEVYRLIAEIDAAADRDSLLVEERIKTLNKLIEDTDRRIGVYMREMQRSRNGEAMYASLGRGIRAALDSRQTQLELIPQETPAQEQKAETPPPAPPPQEAPPPPPPEEPPSKKRGVKKPKVKIQIAELAAQGVPAQKIASRLKLSIAEVELALNLLHRNSHE
jgi:hypothetical protein